jgi:hypothetical protein
MVYYESNFKTINNVGIMEKVEFIRKSDIGSEECNMTASFDFGFDVVTSNKIHLSQLEVFVENERRKDPQNASMATPAGAVVGVNFVASYEALQLDNRNKMLMREDATKAWINQQIHYYI